MGAAGSIIYADFCAIYLRCDFTFGGFYNFNKICRMYCGKLAIPFLNRKIGTGVINEHRYIAVLSLRKELPHSELEFRIIFQTWRCEITWAKVEIVE
jgi:glycyl-tRNA synthetase (class II)